MKTKLDIIISSARALIILLFFYASMSKIVNIPLFKHQMYNQPFPHWMATILLFVVPATEIFAGAMLIFERTARIGLAWSSWIMGAFTIYTAIVLLHFFKYVPCSCGGVIQKLTWPQHLILNISYLGIAFTGYLLIKRKGEHTPTIPSVLEPGHPDF